MKDEVIEILIEFGAHIDTTNSQGKTLFNFNKCIEELKDDHIFPNVISTHLPLSLSCMAANAIAQYGISYCGLPAHVIKFVNLHNPHYFQQFDYCPVQFTDNIFTVHCLF